MNEAQLRGRNGARPKGGNAAQLPGHHRCMAEGRERDAIAGEPEEHGRRAGPTGASPEPFPQRSFYHRRNMAEPIERPSAPKIRRFSFDGFKG